MASTVTSSNTLEVTPLTNLPKILTAKIFIHFLFNERLHSYQPYTCVSILKFGILEPRHSTAIGKRYNARNRFMMKLSRGLLVCGHLSSHLLCTTTCFMYNNVCTIRIQLLRAVARGL